jgi:hypothetical protein
MSPVQPTNRSKNTIDLETTSLTEFAIENFLNVCCLMMREVFRNLADNQLPARVAQYWPDRSEKYGRCDQNQMSKISADSTSLDPMGNPARKFFQDFIFGAGI